MPFNKLIERCSYWYFFYTIVSNVWFLEPVERWICNTLLMFFLSLVVYTTFVYLPGHSVMMLHFFRNLFGIGSEVTVI